MKKSKISSASIANTNLQTKVNWRGITLQYMKKGRIFIVADAESSCKLSLQNHVNDNHQRPKQYKCSFCHYKSVHRDDLTNHKVEHHGVYTCEQCCYLSMYKGKVKRHVETVHKKRYFGCKRCNNQPSSELMGIPKFVDFLSMMTRVSSNWITDGLYSNFPKLEGLIFVRSSH